MKKIKILCLFLLVFQFGFSQNKVEIFDPLINQFLNVRDFTISKDGKEAYFSIQSPSQEISQIVVIKKENGKWTEPQILPFCDENQYFEPFLSPNGKKLFFASNRPNSFKEKNFDIWFVERKNEKEKWSEPINLGTSVNSEMNEFYPSVSDSGNLYLTIDSPTGLGKDDIYMAKWNGTTYEKPQLLNENINSSGYEFNAFISPKEDFLIYTKYGEKD